MLMAHYGLAGLGCRRQSGAGLQCAAPADTLRAVPSMCAGVVRSARALIALRKAARGAPWPCS
jgi:hypothetical protein